MSEDNEIIPKSETNDSKERRTQHILQHIFDTYTADDWTKLTDKAGEVLVNLRTASTAEKRTLSKPVFSLIAIIFLSIVVLAVCGKIEGNYVTSFGGVIVGYLLSFLEVSIHAESN